MKVPEVTKSMTEIYSVLGLEEVDYRQNFEENNILTKKL